MPTALQRNTEFTEADFKSFGLPQLEASDYIKAGTSYFKPETFGGASAAKVLEGLSTNNVDNQKLIAKQGGIPPLIALMTSGSDAAKAAALGALKSLADNADNRNLIIEQGGIAPLTALSHSRDGYVVHIAARMLLALWCTGLPCGEGVRGGWAVCRVRLVHRALPIDFHILWWLWVVYSFIINFWVFLVKLQGGFWGVSGSFSGSFR